MRHTPLFWKLYLTYLLAVVLCAGVVGWLAVGTASDLYHQQAVSDLKARAELASGRVTAAARPPGRSCRPSSRASAPTPTPASP